MHFGERLGERLNGMDLATLNRLRNEPEWKYMQPFKNGDLI